VTDAEEAVTDRSAAVTDRSGAVAGGSGAVGAVADGLEAGFFSGCRTGLPGISFSRRKARRSFAF